MIGVMLEGAVVGRHKIRIRPSAVMEKVGLADNKEAGEPGLHNGRALGFL